ncbi:MAG: FecR domain-containing protein, partial [Desulfobaccales bacterium]
MLKRYCLLVSLLFIALMALGPLAAQAGPVGSFVKVEGAVDLLKGGKVPAVAVKAQDKVDVGDAVRTKSQSRAQIRFVDDTVLTIAPDSRVTIEEYMFNAAKSERKAVLDVARGLVHTAVEKVYPKDSPDF